MAAHYINHLLPAMSNASKLLKTRINLTIRRKTVGPLPKRENTKPITRKPLSRTNNLTTQDIALIRTTWNARTEEKTIPLVFPSQDIYWKAGHFDEGERQETITTVHGENDCDSSCRYDSPLREAYEDFGSCPTEMSECEGNLHGDSCWKLPFPDTSFWPKTTTPIVVKCDSVNGVPKVIKQSIFISPS